MSTFTLQQAAAFLKIHPVTLQEKARAGEITDLTGVVPASGEGVIVRGAQEGGVQVLGRLKP